MRFIQISLLGLLVVSQCFAQASSVSFGGAPKAKTTPCKEMCEELRIVESVFRPLLPEALMGPRRKGQASSAFTVQQCAPIPMNKWIQFALVGSTIAHKLVFDKGCDVKGSLNISNKVFPVDLDLRNLKGVTKALMKEVMLKLSMSKAYNNAIDIDITVRKGKILGEAFKDGELAFNADYSVTVNLVGQIEKNRGGKVAFLVSEEPLKVIQKDLFVDAN